MLEAVLLAAAVIAGVTGAWSPCGLSMVETLAPGGYAGSLRASLAACLTFTAGALAGGVATFGGLAALGGLAGADAGSATVMAIAVAVALVAAVGEARGARILPQIRRQVPESWRRMLPVPVAAGLYGVLLGLGFTTFVLTFAVWALAAVSVALGDPALGALVGLGFGAGRALPVVLLAPANGTAWGIDAHAAMAERPAIYRTLRAVNAVALAACATVLGPQPAHAAQAVPAVVATGATDPSTDGVSFAYDRARGNAVLLTGGARVALPGRDPRVLGPEVAWRDGDAVVIAAVAGLVELAREPAPGADAFAYNAGWVVWRAGRRLLARARGTTEVRVVARVPSPGEVGPPSLDGDVVAFHVAGPRRSRIVAVRLTDGERSELRSTKAALLLQPTLRGPELLYVRSTRLTQELRLGVAAPAGDGAADPVLYATTPTARRDASRQRGRGRRHVHYDANGRPFRPALPPRPRAGVTATLWSTALTDTDAYVTRVVTRRGRTTSSILRVAR